MTVDLNPPYLNTANLTQIMHAKDLWQNLCTYIIYSTTILWQITSIRTLSANNMGKSTSIWTTLGFLCFLTWMLAVQLAENLMELFLHVVRKVVRKELRSEQFGSHLNGKHNKAWCTQFQEISEVPMESYGILWQPFHGPQRVKNSKATANSWRTEWTEWADESPVTSTFRTGNPSVS